MFKLKRFLVLFFCSIGILFLLPKSINAKPITKVTTLVPNYAFLPDDFFGSDGKEHTCFDIIPGITKDSGIRIKWKSNKKSLTLSRGKNVFLLTAGQKTAKLNGKSVKLEETVELSNGVMTAPLGIISKKLSMPNIINRIGLDEYNNLKKQAAEEAAMIAKYVTKDGLTISQPIADDKSVYLWGKVNSRQPVLIKIKKQGGLPRYKIAEVKKKTIDESIYLPDGPGKYAVSLYDRTSLKPLKQETVNLFTVNLPLSKEVKEQNYLLASDYVESNSREIIKLASSITKGKKNNLEKTQAIHDWVSTHIAYDTREYFTGDIQSYTAVEVLHRKKAVCDGYSKLTAALNRAAGIKTKVILGLASNWEPVGYEEGIPLNHAWIETYINGQWYSQDTTWDAGGVTEDEKFIFQLSQNYFSPNQEVFMTDHLAGLVADI
ncbi:transglutaminase domain-containing protein [Actinomycetes bacterium NPDC127524]